MIKFCLLILLLLSSFELFADDKNNQLVTPNDLKIIPQDVRIFANNNKIFANNNKNFFLNKKTGSDKQFKNLALAPWNLKKRDIKILDFNERYFSKISNCSGLNFQHYSKDTIFDIKLNADNAKSIKRNGIIVRHSDLRLIPSDLPCFHPNKPGGAYPFDDYQNSRLYIGSPVSVVGISQDKNWYLVYSHETSIGWVKAENLVFINHSDIRFIKVHKLGVISEDKNNLKIGMFLPIRRETKAQIEVYLPEKSHNGHLHWKITKLRHSEVVVMPMKFNKENVIHVLNNLLNKPYGWGGMHGYRDCSSTIKDYFTTCGIYLKRNSRAQAFSDQAVRSFDLSDKDNVEKIGVIENYGVPFKTVIYLAGHIGLYIGNFNGKPVILHNIWGLKTLSKDDEEGRNIIGKSVISSLELGKESKDVKMTLLDRVERMSVF